MNPYVKGLLLTFALGITSTIVARVPVVSAYQISPLVICIVLGLLIGNVFPKASHKGTAAGIKFSQQKLLRLGIILYGFFITFQEIFSVGLSGLMVDMVIIVTTFIGGTWFGTHIFKLDHKTSMLTAIGSAICGAAAVLGAEPIVKAKPHQTTVAVATVVLFGTIAMFLYPVLYQVFEISQDVMGVYVGATVHEVAQVVAAGNAIGHEVGTTSVIVKLTRVMLLAPLLIALGAYLAKTDRDLRKERASISIPWFAMFFVIAAGINSLNIVPSVVVTAINQASVFLLTVAMGALGLDTNINKIRGVGMKPLLLALLLFAWLLVGGYGITKFIVAWLG